MNKILTTTILCLMSVFIAFAATSDNLAPSAGIQNQVPAIPVVTAPTTENPVESSTRTIYVLFNATDADGVSNFNYTSASVVLTKSGEADRSSSACVNYDNASATMAAFNCTVDLFYYDSSGAWDINATILDINDVIAENNTVDYTYGTLSAMTMAPDAISFGTTLNLGDTDTLATDDPVVLNNTGNQDFSVVNVTAYDLIGQTDPSDAITGDKFSVNVADACEGDALANATITTVTGGVLNHGAEPSLENLYWCLEEVPLGIQAQVYNTTGSNSWLIEVFN